ncbi:MAG TPA: adenosylcobinamide-phosphate synthase CbiB [Bacillota bacterium]|nr:adenosylcobinamide-phosphate synthase CbiB [Bacillota bacterium]
MVVNGILVAIAFIVDLLVGDPAWLVHPVVLIGKGITFCEEVLRKWVGPTVGLRAAGLVLTVIIVTFAYLITWIVVAAAGRVSPWLGMIVSVWLVSTTIASTSLYKAARELFQLLSTGNLEQARVKVGWIVGRDTHSLSESEVVRATVETVAENIVDGIVSPLFYAFLGGAPLAMAYRAVNTLDSMVGYKNERYLQLGWASARFDDAANFLPARLTAVFLVIATALKGLNWRRAVVTIRRDAPKHPSPNSGFPEAAVAGGLGIRLGGLNYYGGIPSHRAFMGDNLRELRLDDIRETWQLMYITAFLATAAGLALVVALGLLRGGV